MNLSAEQKAMARFVYNLMTQQLGNVGKGLIKDQKSLIEYTSGRFTNSGSRGRRTDSPTSSNRSRSSFPKNDQCSIAGNLVIFARDCLQPPRCFNCEQLGHISISCPNPSSPKGGSRDFRGRNYQSGLSN